MRMITWTFSLKLKIKLRWLYNVCQADSNENEDP